MSVVLRHPFSSSGFSLLEILISILILSVALLGIARLQVMNVKNSQSSSYKSQSVFIANSVVDLLRLNRSKALSGNFNVLLKTTKAGNSIEVYEITSWKEIASSELPEGDLSISCVQITALCTVIVQWKSSLLPKGESQQTVVSARL